MGITRAQGTAQHLGNLAHLISIHIARPRSIASLLFGSLDTARLVSMGRRRGEEVSRSKGSPRWVFRSHLTQCCESDTTGLEHAYD